MRSTRGKNSRGHKITGIEPLQGEDKVISFVLKFKNISVQRSMIFCVFKSAASLRRF